MNGVGVHDVKKIMKNKKILKREKESTQEDLEGGKGNGK